MVRVRMTASLIGEHGNDLFAGQVADVSEWFARYLIGRGAAVLADPEAPPLRSSPLTTANLEHGDPVAAHRDPASPKRGRK